MNYLSHPPVLYSFLVMTLSSTACILQHRFANDVVLLIDEMLGGQAAQNFGHGCAKMCMCCGVCTRQSNVSQFLHGELQLRLSALLKSTIYRYTKMKNKSIAHSDVRLALGMCHGRLMKAYYAYTDATRTGWILLSGGIAGGHIAVACNSQCLRHMKQNTCLIPGKSCMNTWVPFVKKYTYCDVECQQMQNLDAQRGRGAIMVAEARLRYRLMLKHSRKMAFITRNCIMQSANMNLAYVLNNQFLTADSGMTETIQCIIRRPGDCLELFGLFKYHDTILSIVERCYWES